MLTIVSSGWSCRGYFSRAKHQCSACATIWKLFDHADVLWRDDHLFNMAALTSTLNCRVLLSMRNPSRSLHRRAARLHAGQGAHYRCSCCRAAMYRPRAAGAGAACALFALTAAIASAASFQHCRTVRIEALPSTLSGCFSHRGQGQDDMAHDPELFEALTASGTRITSRSAHLRACSSHFPIKRRDYFRRMQHASALVRSAGPFDRPETAGRIAARSGDARAR